jgi:bacteriorhodopsin
MSVWKRKCFPHFPAACSPPLVLFYIPSFAGASADAKLWLIRGDLFNRVSVLTAITWSCYPIVWLAGEGHGNISVDTECICYVVLDVLAKSLFGIIIVSARDATTQLTQ